MLFRSKVEIVSEECCTCTWCEINCPEEAIRIEKIFTGDIEFNADKCPSGCSTCVDVCPANAIYLPSIKPAKDLKGEIEPVIAVNKDLCIFCGIRDILLAEGIPFFIPEDAFKTYDGEELDTWSDVGENLTLFVEDGVTYFEDEMGRDLSMGELEGLLTEDADLKDWIATTIREFRA